MACTRMMTLEHTCIFFFILSSILLINCKIYPPSIEYGCFLECLDYLLVERGLDHTPQAELESKCREGVPEFNCETKQLYDEHQIKVCDDPKRFPCVSPVAR